MGCGLATRISEHMGQPREEWVPLALRPPPEPEHSITSLESGSEPENDDNLSQMSSKVLSSVRSSFDRTSATRSVPQSSCTTITSAASAPRRMSTSEETRNLKRALYKGIVVLLDKEHHCRKCLWRDYKQWSADLKTQFTAEKTELEMFLHCISDENNKRFAVKQEESSAWTTLKNKRDMDYLTLKRALRSKESKEKRLTIAKVKATAVGSFMGTGSGDYTEDNAMEDITQAPTGGCTEENHDNPNDDDVEEEHHDTIPEDKGDSSATLTESAAKQLQDQDAPSADQAQPQQGDKQQPESKEPQNTTTDNNDSGTNITAELISLEVVPQTNSSNDNSSLHHTEEEGNATGEGGTSGCTEEDIGEHGSQRTQAETPIPPPKTAPESERTGTQDVGSGQQTENDPETVTEVIQSLHVNISTEEHQILLDTIKEVATRTPGQADIEIDFLADMEEFPDPEGESETWPTADSFPLPDIGDSFPAVSGLGSAGLQVKVVSDDRRNDKKAASCNIGGTTIIGSDDDDSYSDSNETTPAGGPTNQCTPEVATLTHNEDCSATKATTGATCSDDVPVDSAVDISGVSVDYMSPIKPDTAVVEEEKQSSTEPKKEAEPQATTGHSPPQPPSHEPDTADTSDSPPHPPTATQHDKAATTASTTVMTTTTTDDNTTAGESTRSATDNEQQQQPQQVKAKEEHQEKGDEKEEQQKKKGDEKEEASSCATTERLAVAPTPTPPSSACPEHTPHRKASVQDPQQLQQLQQQLQQQQQQQQHKGEYEDSLPSSNSTSSDGIVRTTKDILVERKKKDRATANSTTSQQPTPPPGDHGAATAAAAAAATAVAAPSPPPAGHSSSFQRSTAAVPSGLSSVGSSCDSLSAIVAPTPQPHPSNQPPTESHPPPPTNQTKNSKLALSPSPVPIAPKNGVLRRTQSMHRNHVPVGGGGDSGVPVYGNNKPNFNQTFSVNADHNPTTLREGGFICVCGIEELPIKRKKVLNVNGRSVLFYRTSLDDIYAVDNKCFHLGGALSEGEIEESPFRNPCVVCPLHKRCIDMNTGCASINPALKPSKNDPRVDQRVYDVRIYSSGVWLATKLPFAQTLPSDTYNHSTGRGWVSSHKVADHSNGSLPPLKNSAKI